MTPKQLKQWKIKNHQSTNTYYLTENGSLLPNKFAGNYPPYEMEEDLEDTSDSKYALR